MFIETRRRKYLGIHPSRQKGELRRLVLVTIFIKSQRLFTYGINSVKSWEHFFLKKEIEYRKTAPENLASIFLDLAFNVVVNHANFRARAFFKSDRGFDPVE